MKFIVSILLCSVVIEFSFVKSSRVSEKNVNLYDIEGTVYPPDIMPNSKKLSWLTDTEVYLKGGHHIGFLRDDGSFTISKVPPGSYIVEVKSSNYVYEPVRIDINTKGKFRARRINYVLNTQINPLPYPMKMKALGNARYFQVREQWRLIDLLFNPMVLMMILPLACIMLLPHVMNDPESKKDMEQLQNLTKYDVPEFSEIITKYFSHNKEKPNTGRAIKAKKENKRN